MWFENNVCLLRTIVHKYLLKTNKLRTPKMWFITFHSVDNLIEVQNHKNFQLCWTFVVDLQKINLQQNSHAKFRSYYISHLNINLLLQEGKWNKYWHVFGNCSFHLESTFEFWKLRIDYTWYAICLFSIKDLCSKIHMNSNI